VNMNFCRIQGKNLWEVDAINGRLYFGNRGAPPTNTDS
jgi:hypothetical protein